MGYYEMATLGLSVVGLFIVLGFVLEMEGLPDFADDQQCFPLTEAETLKCGNQEVLLHEYMQKEVNDSFARIDKDTQDRFDRRRITLKYYVKNRYWQMKPAARFTGKPDLTEGESTNPNNDMVPLVNWKTGHKLHHWGGFKRYGICYKHGRIAVPVSGVYYLYSHLDLYHPSVHYNDDKITLPKNETFKVSLFKYNYNKEEETELLTALTPHKSSGNGHFNRYTSFVSGLVNLTAGEEISLKVSDVNMLRFPENNCMGVNLL